MKSTYLGLIILLLFNSCQKESQTIKMPVTPRAILHYDNVSYPFSQLIMTDNTYTTQDGNYIVEFLLLSSGYHITYDGPYIDYIQGMGNYLYLSLVSDTYPPASGHYDLASSIPERNLEEMSFVKGEGFSPDIDGEIILADIGASIDLQLDDPIQKTYTIIVNGGTFSAKCKGNFRMVKD